MRKTLLWAGVLVLLGVLLGTVAWQYLNTTEQKMQPRRSGSQSGSADLDLLAQSGERTFSGVVFGYRTTQGASVRVHYIAPPRSRELRAFPLVTLNSPDTIRIDDGVHSVLIDVAKGTIVLNGVQYISNRPAKDRSLFDAKTGCNIHISGDAQIHVNEFAYVPISGA